MRLTRALSVPALLLAACSPHASTGAESPPVARPAVHPISGLPVIPLAVISRSGRHVFRVEVARGDAEQARGLMFRTRMGSDEGMIFPMNPPRLVSFWMRNTVIPLDIIFIAPDRRVLNIVPNAVPYDETPLPSRGPASAVLELNGGRAAELGIVPGDRVEW